ncbi:MAG: hypothetical protein U9P50_02735 [Patescibacteria group bacterium]|nr:hypothetical protein [Patescibacteria group bacterium]
MKKQDEVGDVNRLFDSISRAELNYVMGKENQALKIQVFQMEVVINKTVKELKALLTQDEIWLFKNKIVKILTILDPKEG